MHEGEGKTERSLRERWFSFSAVGKKRIRTHNFYHWKQARYKPYFTLQNLVKPVNKGQSTFS